MRWLASIAAVTVSLLLAAKADLDLPISPPKRGKQASLPESPPESPPLGPSRKPGELPTPLPEPPPAPPKLSFFGENYHHDTFVFILDKSGSMIRLFDSSASDTRTLWDVVRDETIRAIGELDERSRFDVVVYSTDSAAAFGVLRSAMATNKAAAVAWLRAVAVGGGTLTGEHTAWALWNYRDCERFLLLSDGLPRDPTAAAALIRGARAQHQRVSTIGVRLDVRGASFMMQVAAENGGTYTEVR